MSGRIPFKSNTDTSDTASMYCRPSSEAHACGQRSNTIPPAVISKTPDLPSQLRDLASPESLHSWQSKAPATPAQTVAARRSFFFHRPSVKTLSQTDASIQPMSPGISPVPLDQQTREPSRRPCSCRLWRCKLQGERQRDRHLKARQNCRCLSPMRTAYVVSARSDCETRP
jgi:hypothetical protein